MTIRLYDQDVDMLTFSAVVKTCERRENGYVVTLDQTAFFPEKQEKLSALPKMRKPFCAFLLSRPVWGAWIEIAPPPDPLPIPRVAPRMGWLFTGYCLPACPGISPAAAFSPRAGWRCTCRNRTG